MNPTQLVRMTLPDLNYVIFPNKQNLKSQTSANSIYLKTPTIANSNYKKAKLNIRDLATYFI